MQVHFLCHAFFRGCLPSNFPLLTVVYANVKLLLQALVFPLDTRFLNVKPLLQALVFSLDTCLCNAKPFLQALV